MERMSITTSQDVVKEIHKAKGDVPVSRWITRHFEELFNIPEEKRAKYR